MSSKAGAILKSYLITSIIIQSVVSVQEEVSAKLVLSRRSGVVNHVKRILWRMKSNFLIRFKKRLPASHRDATDVCVCWTCPTALWPHFAQHQSRGGDTSLFSTGEILQPVSLSSIGNLLGLAQNGLMTSSRLTWGHKLFLIKSRRRRRRCEVDGKYKDRRF